MEPLFSEKRIHIRRQRNPLKSHYLADELTNTLVKRLQDLKINTTDKSLLCLGLTKNLMNQIDTGLMEHISLSSFSEDLFFEQLGNKHFDIITDCFLVHWLNDPLTYVRKILDRLNPGGIYFSAFPGGYTLKELRFALVEADLEIYGGASSRVSPMITPEAFTRVLQVAGFKDPVVDHEVMQLEHASLDAGLNELRLFSETSAFHGSEVKPLTKKHLEFLKTSLENQKTGKVLSTFDVVYGLAIKA